MPLVPELITVRLEKKLRDPWSSPNIGSIITDSAIEEVINNFEKFETSFKCRFMLSFLTLPPDKIYELESAIKAILSRAKDDQNEVTYFNYKIKR